MEKFYFFVYYLFRRNWQKPREQKKISSDTPKTVKNLVNRYEQGSRTRQGGSKGRSSKQAQTMLFKTVRREKKINFFC
jgi:hypothetical protein